MNTRAHKLSPHVERKRKNEAVVVTANLLRFLLTFAHSEKRFECMHSNHICPTQPVYNRPASCLHAAVIVAVWFGATSVLCSAGAVSAVVLSFSLVDDFVPSTFGTPLHVA